MSDKIARGMAGAALRNGQQITQDIAEVGVNKYDSSASGIAHGKATSSAGVLSNDVQLQTTDFIYVPYGKALIFTSEYNGARSVLTNEGDNTIVRCLCVYDTDKETEIPAEGFAYQTGKTGFYNIASTGGKYVRVSLLESNVKVVADLVEYDTDEYTTYTASLGLDDYYPYTVTHRTEVKKTAVESWYKGKTIAVIGDSITELATWKQFVEDALGCSFVNLGVGGSTVCDCSARTDYICSDGRINTIPLSVDGVIVWGGHNDWGNQATVGTITPNWTLSDANSKGEFVSALALTFKKIITRVPNVPVMSMTLLNGRTSSANVNQDSQMYLNNLCMTDFSKAVKTVSEYFSIPCIDIGANAGVSVLNHTDNILTDDVIHPNENGGKKIAAEMINGMMRYQPIA